ncbi:MAG: phosphoribosyltransferase family protein, partial [Verrucomicrobiota bacterium]
MFFKDRIDAGCRLAQKLSEYAGRENLLVLGLPRGGVPVAFEVAAKLGAPLDVFVVRKLGTPGHKELAMGALASGGVRVINPEVLSRVINAEVTLEAATQSESMELTRREALYREGRLPLSVKNQTVLVVDDGLATGATMRAAVAALRKLGAAQIVVAIPVGAAS